METTDNYIKHTSKNPLHKFFINNFYSSFLSLVKGLDVKKILDVGCGEGFTLEKLREEGIGEILEGIDSLQTAITIGKKIHPNLHLKKADVYNLTYKANSFDLVICTEVLEHLTDPIRAYTEMLRISKKYLLFSVPNEPFFTLQRFFRGNNILMLGWHPEHINHWSALGFTRLVNSEKVKILEKKYPFPWTMILLQKM